jgi:hypothetical protein
MVPNPEKKTAYTKVEKARRTLHLAETTLLAALAAHEAIPARLPLSQVNPGQQVLDTETKLIHHAIRIAAFNTAQTLARAIATNTGYSRADDEAHTLIRTALTTSASTRYRHHATPPPSTNSARHSTRITRMACWNGNHSTAGCTRAGVRAGPRPGGISGSSAAQSPWRNHVHTRVCRLGTERGVPRGGG